jgi:uncharacterized protein (DUF302 family)
MPCLRAAALALVGLVLVGTARADDGLIVKPSAHPVAATLDRLEDALGEKGILIVARVDHAANASGAGLALPPTELLIFGNPKLGTPLMQSTRTIGIDLPMKALVWEDAAGDVFLAYNDPAWLAARHGIDDRAEVVQTMSGALAALTDAATSAD